MLKYIILSNVESDDERNADLNCRYRSGQAAKDWSKLLSISSTKTSI